VYHRGNNVNSIGPDGYTRRPKINDDYTYHYDARKEPNVGENTDASVVNAFWVGNRVHDIAYRYGFTETAFNYQSHNFKKGGKEGDPVLMYVQDKSGMNNAYFISVPELVLNPLSFPPHWIKLQRSARSRQVLSIQLVHCCLCALPKFCLGFWSHQHYLAQTR